MASDARQERQLMRQRGAGNRQINNVDFGFAFNTPSHLRRSRTRSRTPQTATHNRRPSLRTPREIAKHLILDTPSSTHFAKTLRSPSTDRDEGTLTQGQPPSKRRRLSEISNLTNVTNVGPLLHTAYETIDEADEATIDQAERGSPDENDKGVKNTPRDVLGEDKENDVNVLSSNRLGSKQRKRKSIGQQRTKRKRLSIDSTTQNQNPQELQSHTQEDNNGAVHDEQTNGFEDRLNSSIINMTQVQEDATLRKLVDLSTARSRALSISSEGALLPKEKKRKKSVLFTRKKKRSTGPTSQKSVSANADFSQHYRNETPDLTQEEGRDDQLDLGFGDGQEQADCETYDGTEVLIHDQAKKPKRNQDEVKSDDSEASDQEYHPDEGSAEPTPAPNRRSRPVEPKKKLNARSKEANARNTKTSRSTSNFPVLTHRITNLQQLPTILEASEAEEANEFEPSAHPPGFTTHDAPNAIDVLAQICRETVDSTIASFQKQSHTKGTSKALVKQKLEALQGFRAELENRLFGVSQSLDQRLQLEARIRKSRREKASVQAQWLEIRKRRDQIALRIDAVRRRHWENEIVGKKAWEASETAMKLEAQLQKSRADEDGQVDEMADTSGQLEIMLRDLAGDVSSLNGRGILQRLRGLNAQLERFAGSIERQ